MLNIVITLLTFLLIIICLFMVLVILMQRASSNSGMGSAFGGGVAESAFGAETTNILTRATKWSAMAFFVISLALYLLYMNRQSLPQQGSPTELPDIPVATETETPPAAQDSVETVTNTVPESTVPGNTAPSTGEESATPPEPDTTPADSHPAP